MYITDKVTIREATLKDIPMLLQFEQGVIQTERVFDTTLKAQATYYDMEAMIAAPHIRLVVAESNTVVIASGYARIKDAEQYLKHTQYAYLGFMYVVPEYRGQGINKTIINDLKAWIKAKGLDEIWLEVYVDNAPAIKAYEKIGFSKHLYTMRTSLKDEDVAAD
jgi:ribosomal protein S18 acetylase RimI-like enzyme